ncbi:hypothetical protein GALMADRAFT_1218128 [Galerina marginata CBS 339.88]|uniref:Uncharacterized protein n=1 Tax=Galerina marginata (strain CBS 339.88) TaxID=685588 RepID=A0A067S4L7_GALM3|nr:hypothetical protein GALMADRAFT_1218128 [Galerina marginata CBS 339.88]
MSLQLSSSSASSRLSMSNIVAVQFQNYLRGSDTDSVTLAEWTVSRMTVNYSDRSIPSRSCAHHEYIIVEASNRDNDQLRLRLDHTKCSSQLSPAEVNRILTLLSAQGLLRESRRHDLGNSNGAENPTGPPNTPAFSRASMDVSTDLSDPESDLCIKQICFPFFSDLNSVYSQSSHSTDQTFDVSRENLCYIFGVSGNDDTFVNDATDFTLLDLGQLISSKAVRGYHSKEKDLLPPCHLFTLATTEALRLLEYPVIENHSVLMYGVDETIEDALETLSVRKEFCNRTLVASVENECLLTERRILALKLRLSIAEVALSGANVKLFNLQHPAHKINPAGDHVQIS